MINIFKTALGKTWERIGIKIRHGILCPLFSIHSHESSGIGEFLDLIPLIDWCQELGLEVIQLLPLNDLENDPSPYNSISANAICPIFLSLEKLPFVTRDLLSDLKSLKKLNSEKRVCYNEVRVYKNLWLKKYFEYSKNHILSLPEFKNFEKTNHWLGYYCLFKVLREQFGFTSWQSWPEDFKKISHARYLDLLSKFDEQILFYKFLQYLCFSQLTFVKNYANSKGVLLKGDIPILISKDSADAWFHNELFNFHYTAGAPPDNFNEETQNWNFPIFDWKKLKETHYSWWKERLKYASNFYNIYRIDHAGGFYRLWSIPKDCPGRAHYIPKPTGTWIERGAAILKEIATSSPMLPIAEDLGNIPIEIKNSLMDLGICGTRVMRWEMKNGEFIPFEKYPLLSMTCVSTTDSETLAMWWKDSPKQAKLYAKMKNFTYQPTLTPEKRLEILYDSHHSNSLFHINLLQEYLALFPDLVSTNLSEERINIPGTVGPHNWTYRLTPSVEEITKHTGLKDAFHRILSP